MVRLSAEETVTLTPAAARWSALIDRHERSGQTLRAFAADNDINPNTLAWWRSRLGRVQRPATEPFLEVVVDPAPSSPPQNDDGTVVLVLDDLRAHVVVDRETDLALLKQLLGVLC